MTARPRFTGWRQSHARRDHALALQRFVGGVQLFGGLTLVVAYRLGADALQVPAASTLLVGVGVLQMVLGAVCIARPRSLRRWVLRRPGTVVALALVGAIASFALGGSGVDRAYLTSAQCWLILAGSALLGRRWLAATLLVTGIVIPVWAAFDGPRAGFSGDGHLLSAVVALVASVAAGLWMGRVSGAAAATLNRWYLVEFHELGVVDRLRDALAQVRERAERLSEALRVGRAQESAELVALRERLAGDTGLDGAVAGDRTELSTVLARIQRAQGRQTLDIAVESAAGANQIALGAVVADALHSVLRRQLDNVARHAPSASKVRVLTALHRGVLSVRLEDDGGGELPFRAGVGTAWSERQLARVGGTIRYYAGERGVGVEIQIPAAATEQGRGLAGLSIRRSLEQFGLGLLDAVRLAGYVGDTVTVSSQAEVIGSAWLLMPIGAVCIEVSIRAGRAGRWRLDPVRGAVLASILSAATTAALVAAAGPEVTLIAGTTSVLVPALVLLVAAPRLWGVAEALRLLGVAPLLLAEPAAAVGLVLVYPAGVYALVLLLKRFIRRSRALEARTLDALGRAGLAAAVVRGLALRHDAIDVLARNPTDPAARASARELEAALGRLDHEARASVDPRDIVKAGVGASLGSSLEGPATELDATPGSAVPAGAVDRVTLFELAALAADERASCAPPGVFGRRRLQHVDLQWRDAAHGEVLRLVARPTLTDPDPDAVASLNVVAAALGVEVASAREALTLTYAPR